MKNFQDLIEKERERLTKLSEEYQAQIADLETKLAEIEKEMRAITAYEAAKQDKPTRATRSTKASGRAPRGSKREEILAVIQKTPGITRGEIIDTLGVKGQKGQEQGVSNALAAMKKAGAITAEDGKYRAA